MKKIGIFYGSTTGTTRRIAGKIAECLGVADADVHDVAKTAPSKVGDYDVLIFGASTWGPGDLQEDMDTFLNGVMNLDFRDKEVAIFGCGDETMSESFCNSVGEIYHKLHDTHAQFVGPFNNDGYVYRHSDSDVKGMIVGLCIDENNHPEETDARVKAWCDEIKREFC